MKRSFGLLLGRQFRPFVDSYRFIANKSNKKYEGIRERIDEKEARLYFDKWIKSLW